MALVVVAHMGFASEASFRGMDASLRMFKTGMAYGLCEFIFA